MQRISEKTPCEWLLIQKELFVTFNSEKDRIQSEDKITSYVKNLTLDDGHELLQLNRLVERQTFMVQRMEIDYQHKLDRWSHWERFTGMKPISFFQ